MRATDSNTRWFKLQVTSTPKVLLVLDASESAEEYENEVLELAAQVIAGLPESAQVRVAFLGSTEMLSTEQFTLNRSELWTKHLGRCSLINPVLRAAGPIEEHRVAVIGTGTIFDLEDQADTLGSRLLLVSAVPERGPNDDSWSSLMTRQAREVVDRLWTRVTGVTIGGPELLPLYWDNDAYRLVIGDRGAELKLEGGNEPSTRVGFLTHGNSLPSARVTYADGREVEVSLAATRPFDRELRPLRLLTAGEACPFYLATADGSPCDPAALPRICRSTVRDWSGFVLLADSVGGLMAYAYPWEIIATGPESAAAYRPGGATGIVFDRLRHLWKVSPELEIGGCLELGGKVYAVAV